MTIVAVKHDYWFSLIILLFIESKHFVVKQPVTDSTDMKVFQISQGRVRQCDTKESVNQGPTHHLSSV